MEILNRKAHYNYYIKETYEAGIELVGTEIKSIRKGSCNINECYGRVKNGEIFLTNMYIAKYDEGNRFNHDERRTRKLLLHKIEIKHLNDDINKQGYTLIPLEVYLKNNHAKVLLGVCKGKHTYDKRQTIKERDLKREARNV